MASVTDFLNQFDEEGRYSALDGVLDVVFATRGDGRYPGKLHFSNGLCVRAKMEGGGDWAYPDNSPLNGIRFLLDFGDTSVHGIVIDQGRIVHLDEAQRQPTKREFLINFGIARNLFAHPRVTADSPSIDTATMARTLARAAIWLTPKSVAGFNAADFPELGLDRQRELQSAVQDFLAVARQVPADKPATDAQYGNITMETTLDPKVQPFLYDHRIDGTPVLPGVMGIEAFAEAALCVHPGWHIEAIEEVYFLAPFKFYKDEPRTVIINAVIRPEGDKLMADCRLIGRRILAGQTQPQETIHFTARVRVSKQLEQAAIGSAPRLTADAIVDAAHIYRIYFHGPAYRVIERAWSDGERMIGELASPLPANHQPSDRPTLMSPRLIELCFQTAGLWQLGKQSSMGLPQQVQQVSSLRAPQLAEGHLYAIVTPHPEQGNFDAEVVDAKGCRYLRLNGYRTVAVAGGVDPESLQALQTVVSNEAVAVP